MKLKIQVGSGWKIVNKSWHVGVLLMEQQPSKTQECSQNALLIPAQTTKGRQHS